MSQLESIRDSMLIRDRIYEMLRKEILSGGFAPGETLNILSISKQLGVSCSPVREALNLLNKDGLVDLMPYKKAKVADGSPEEFEIAYDIRVMLEPYALGRSIMDIPQEDIDELRERMKEIRDHPDSMSEFYECDTDFHHLLYCYTDSKILASTLDSLRALTVRFYAMRATYQNHINESWGSAEDAIRGEMEEHLAILEAVARRDKNEACRLLKEHVISNSAMALGNPLKHQAPQSDD